MRYDPEKHHRRSIRLRGYDYSREGAYFVTICAQEHLCLFGEVVDGEMRLNDAGRIAKQCWLAIPDHFPHAQLDAFVVMPNHVHGIIVIVGARHHMDVGARHAVPLQEQFGRPVPGSIPTIIRSVKSATTKRINEIRNAPGTLIWQRNYYEHIIRDEESLNRIREYILSNPLRWHLDRENPERLGDDEFDKWLRSFPKKVTSDAG
jgi:REP element-mobilizing transposase RayT